MYQAALWSKPAQSITMFGPIWQRSGAPLWGSAGGARAAAHTHPTTAYGLMMIREACEPPSPTATDRRQPCRRAGPSSISPGRVSTGSLARSLDTRAAAPRAAGQVEGGGPNLGTHSGSAGAPSRVWLFLAAAAAGGQPRRRGPVTPVAPTRIHTRSPPPHSTRPPATHGPTA